MLLRVLAVISIVCVTLGLASCSSEQQAPIEEKTVTRTVTQPPETTREEETTELEATQEYEPEPTPPEPQYDPYPTPVPTPTPAPAPSTPPVRDVDCSDFSSSAEAQPYLLPGDPYNLDADGDGQACDSL